MNKNNNPVSNAHDNFFRTAMANKKVAKDFLKAHLPEDIRRVIDLDNLNFQPRSHIDDIRKETIVDILYKTKIADREGYVYLLLEHQSRPDELMPFRILKYICNIISQDLEQTRKKTIPLIYPMVIYHAERPYPYSTDIRDLVDAPKELVDRYFLKPFHLIDLAKIDDQELKRHAWAGALEFALKHIFARDILPYLEDIAQLLHRIDQSGGRDYILIVLQYILERGQVADVHSFFDLINNKVSPDVKENFMTLAEKLELRGELRGEQRGMLMGEQQKTLEVAQKMLSENIEYSLIAKITGLSLNEISELQSNAKVSA